MKAIRLLACALSVLLLTLGFASADVMVGPVLLIGGGVIVVLVVLVIVLAVLLIRVIRKNKK